MQGDIENKLGHDIQINRLFLYELRLPLWYLQDEFEDAKGAIIIVYRRTDNTMAKHFISWD